MNISKLNGLIELKDESLEDVREELVQLVEQYPYSGPFRMLLAKASKDAGHLDQRKDLLSAAAHCTSRKALFDVMFSESFRVQAREIHKAIELLDEVSEDELVDLIWHSDKPDDSDLNIEETSLREDVVKAVSSSIESEMENLIESSSSEENLIKKISSNLENEKNLINSSNIEGEEPEIIEVAAPNSLFGKWLYERAIETDFGTSSLAERQVEHGSAAIIDSFLKINKPTIGTLRDIDSPSIEWANKGLAEDPSLVTETMAKLYAKQGQMSRARKAFKMLALQYPDKSVYFAAQLKKLIKNKNL
tara:strand:- start:357 stop:1271 length:915 start_codon:yes stop_codon:yes gene_type:complete